MKLSAAIILSAVAVQSASAFVVPSSGSPAPATMRLYNADVESGTEFSSDADVAAEAGLEAVELPPKDIFDTPMELPGVVAPLGFWDPLDFAAKADGPTMRRYREAEVTHGRVGMLAVLGALTD